MFDKSGFFGESFEQIDESLMYGGKAVKSLPQDLTKTATQQVSGPQQQSQSGQKQHQPEPSYVEDFVEQLYAPSQPHPKQQAQSQPSSQQADPNNPQVVDQVQQQQLSEQANQKKMQELRNKLHKEYYEKVFAYEQQKPGESVEEQEEKQEKQKKEQMKLQEKEEKKKELPVNMRQKGSGEAKHGVGG